jgi:hypothetical protein
MVAAAVLGKVASSEGGMVLHLQALGGGVGCGLVNKPMEEGAGDREGGDCCHCHGFKGRGHGLLSPLSTSSSPTLLTTRTMTTRAQS